MYFFHVLFYFLSLLYYHQVLLYLYHTLFSFIVQARLNIKLILGREVLVVLLGGWDNTASDGLVWLVLQWYKQFLLFFILWFLGLLCFNVHTIYFYEQLVWLITPSYNVFISITNTITRSKKLLSSFTKRIT